jgi:hypothetical protein
MILNACTIRREKLNFQKLILYSHVNISLFLLIAKPCRQLSPSHLDNTSPILVSNSVLPTHMTAPDSKSKLKKIEFCLQIQCFRLTRRSRSPRGDATSAITKPTWRETSASTWRRRSTRTTWWSFSKTSNSFKLVLPRSVWQGVAVDFLKLHLGPTCPTLLCPADGHWATPQGEQPAAVFYP